MKEQVILDLSGAPEAYRDFISQRNGAIASKVAKIMDIPFVQEAPRDIYSNSFIVPATTVTTERAQVMGIFTPEDFYGTSTPSLDLVGKSLLHPTVSQNAPSFHSNKFARNIQNVVLPGVTAFSRADLINGIIALKDQGYTPRIKLPNESDGNGQFTVTPPTDIDAMLRGTDFDEITDHGIIAEAQVDNPHTISVGFAQINGVIYSFCAYQKDDRVQIDTQVEKSRYKGANVIVTRGSMGNLLETPGLDIEAARAIAASGTFHQEYTQHFQPVSSRISYDYLHGTSNGIPLSGITDITGRLGGTCPAILLAVESFLQNPTAQFVKSEVTLNYTPSQVLPEEKHATIFANHPALRITSRVNRIL